MLLNAHMRLSFEALGITVNHRKDEREYPEALCMGLLAVEMVLVVVCLVQICRFWKHRVFLKKVVHMLIILHMIACIFQAVDIAGVYKRFLHEVTFIFCSLLYLSVLLLWVDFYENLERGFRIQFLQSNTLLWFMCGYAWFYLGMWFAIHYYAFDGKDEESLLSSYTAWWHLSFYAVILVGMLQVSYCIVAMLGKSHFPILTNRCVTFARRTSRTLGVVCFCFFLRFFSTLLFVLCQFLPVVMPQFEWDTWLGFLILYLFDRILPVLVFVILMRRVPSVHPQCNNNNDGSDSQYSLRGINSS